MNRKLEKAQTCVGAVERVGCAQYDGMNEGVGLYVWEIGRGWRKTEYWDSLMEVFKYISIYLCGPIS